MIRVGVFGAAGRMGSAVCRAVASDPGAELVAAVDPGAAGSDAGTVAGLEPCGVVIGVAADAMTQAGVEVAVDFTVASSAVENMRWCAAHRVHAVIGTSGISDSEREEMAVLFRDSGANCVIAPNFAIGAVLMMRFAEIAAVHMDAAEIIELHHDRKVDAPSGTSLSTAGRMSGARAASGARPFPEDPTTSVTLEGTRGGVTEGGVHIHSVRSPGLVAHQEVILGSPGESLTIRHDSFDRASFMPGVLLAVKRVGELPGLTVGIEGMLGL